MNNRRVRRGNESLVKRDKKRTISLLSSLLLNGTGRKVSTLDERAKKIQKTGQKNTN